MCLHGNNARPAPTDVSVVQSCDTCWESVGCCPPRRLGQLAYDALGFHAHPDESGQQIERKGGDLHGFQGLVIGIIGDHAGWMHLAHCRSMIWITNGLADTELVHGDAPCARLPFTVLKINWPWLCRIVIDLYVFQLLARRIFILRSSNLVGAGIRAPPFAD